MFRESGVNKKRERRKDAVEFSQGEKMSSQVIREARATRSYRTLLAEIKPLGWGSISK